MAKERKYKVRCRVISRSGRARNVVRTARATNMSNARAKVRYRSDPNTRIIFIGARKALWQK